MKEPDKKQEKTLVININLTRRLVSLLAIALLSVAFLGYLAWGQEEAAASNPQAPLAASTGLRQYYSTKTGLRDGADADTACASGYHMASLWEILHTGNLAYNTTLGGTQDDSGQGPPTCWHGWVRTGYDSNNTSSEGLGNCNNWSSNSSSDYGTVARLPCDWTQAQQIHVWQAWTTGCNSTTDVWCVAD